MTRPYPVSEYFGWPKGHLNLYSFHCGLCRISSEHFGLSRSDAFTISSQVALEGGSGG